MNIFFILAFFLINILVNAKTITLDEAITLSLKNGKDVQISEKDVAISKDILSSSFKTALPSVVYNSKYQKGEYERRMGTEDNEFSKEGYTQSIGILQPLFRGGAILASIKQQQINKEVAMLNYLSQKRDTRLNVIKNYSNIINSKRNLIAYLASKKELETNYEKQKMQLSMKLIIKSDILKTEYYLLDVESKILTANNNIKIEKDRLKINIGIPEEEEIEVVDFSIPENLLKNINFEKDLAKAKKSSIASLIASKNSQFALENKTIKRAEMMPKIDAFAGYGTYMEESKFDNTTKNGEWRGGVQVNWNVFQFGKDYDAYKATIKNVEKLKIAEDQTIDNIQLNVTSAYLELIRLEKIKESKHKAMLTAEENYFVDKERYNGGLISVVDYLISETLWRNSQVEYNTLLNEYYVAFEKYRSLLI